MRCKNPCRRIDPDTWNRREHYEVFSRQSYPYIGVTVSVDVERLVVACREAGTRFSNAFMYAALRALNSVENLRYRIVDGEVVLCERVDPSFNVWHAENELFYFAYADYHRHFALFDAEVEEAKKQALTTRSLNNENGDRADVVFVSSLPWFAFSDIIQPMGLTPDDAIPRLLWGRHSVGDGKGSMPFSLTGHHGLFDGWHVAKMLAEMERLLNDPSFLAEG